MQFRSRVLLTDRFKFTQQGVYWTGTILSLLFVLTRLFIRHRVIGYFKADDYLVVVAWVLYLAATITWTVMGNNLYVTLDAGKTGSFLGALNSYLQQYAHALNANLGAYYCTWTSLYVIKLSFMVFFHGLGNNFRAQKFVWWGVLSVIVACYIVSVAMFDYGCLTADWENIISTYLAL